MIETLFPAQTLVRRVVPKTTFVNQLDANARMKEHFTRDIERIEWLAKLAPSTINVANGTDVHEIAVFSVPLKVKDCPDDIFTFIDSLVPRHMLFVLTYEEQVCWLINYKERVSGNTDKKFRIIKTFRSAWQPTTELALSLQGSSMDALYDYLIRQVAGGQITSANRDLRAAIEETAAKVAKQKEIAALEKRIAQERQPNKKFELHRKLQELKTEQHG